MGKLVVRRFVVEDKCGAEGGFFPRSKVTDSFLKLGYVNLYTSHMYHHLLFNYLFCYFILSVDKPLSTDKTRIGFMDTQIINFIFPSKKYNLIKFIYGWLGTFLILLNILYSLFSDKFNSYYTITRVSTQLQIFYLCWKNRLKIYYHFRIKFKI